jgi:two-component system sensor histidine kinase KdpD
VYVETPQLHALPENQRRAILSSLRLAQELGAETATLSDPQEDKAILRYAREHNLGKIVIGRRQHRRWFSRESFADKLARRAPDLDLVIVALDDKPTPCPAARRTAVPSAINGAFSSAAVWSPSCSAP